MIPQVLPIRYYLNPGAWRGRPFGPAEREVLSAEANRAAFREISSWEAYQPTPLRELPTLSADLGVKAILYKDEGSRLGVGSFKALGGAYGVFRILKRELERLGIGPVASAGLMEGDHREVTGGITVACASLGNHGRSVAWGARLFGSRSVVFLPRDTDSGRVERIRSMGAEIVPVDGTYDDSVALVAERAEEEGWFVVSDTAWPGYEEVPAYVMQGYTVMAREALVQMEEVGAPTHVFLQAGVGGLAAAVTGYLWQELGLRKPRVVVVEPAEADCLLETALAGRPTPSRGSLVTSMSCLACRDPSTLAWKILEGGADAFLTIPDYATRETVSLLASARGGDPPIASQPSGVAGVTGLIAASFEPTLSDPLDLGENSVVLVFGSEGPP